ncbi:hypothetical protein EIP91_006501 [Steccherinum ochraceum]|uniref:SB domain-containing protein n=1 Tax=Steccherinum ochraceum TaxID=92696 RepID=A0A4R0S145_9APHY|nr:hypothetical protein EIP91_006501 [Steccherinum ochraceum]
MLVRAGKSMDVSGRCRIEYLSGWERKSEGCSLTALLEAMQDHFSREPPVYAKPKSPSPSSQSPQPRRPDNITPSYSERPPPPLPGGPTSTTPSSHPSQSIIPKNDDRPPIPLKPGASPIAVSPVRSSSQDARGTSPNIFHNTELTTRPPPPLPPHLPTNVGVPQRGDSPIPPRYDASSRESSNVPGVPIDLRMRPPPLPPPHPSNSPAQIPLAQPMVPPYQGPTAYAIPQPAQPAPRPPPPPPPPTSIFSQTVSPAQSPQYPASSYSPVPYSLPPPVLSPQSTGMAQPGYPVYVAPVPPPVITSPAPPPPAPSIPPPDLLDNDDLASVGATSNVVSPAPAPPRPPNPELLRLHHQVHVKMTSELASLSQAMALDAERLRANQADLLAGEPAVRDEMARLEAVRDVCRSVAGRLRTVVEAAERNVAELKRKGDPEVDELVCSTSIVHNQLINLVAEDNAIEDTMYHLHRALNAGRIDLERFLKTTRVLAEEQFMKRALIEKILTGLPMGSQWQ